MRIMALLLLIGLTAATAQDTRIYRICYGIVDIADHCTKAPEFGVSCEVADAYVTGTALKLTGHPRFSSVMGTMCYTYCQKPESFKPEELFDACVKALKNNSGSVSNF